MIDPVLVDALKIVLISGLFSLLQWVFIYSMLAPWWHNNIGRTLVIKTVLIAMLFVPSILNLFFHLNAATSYAMGWVDVCLIGAVTPVMIWRTVVWLRIERLTKKDKGN
jgi:hypothetical protein